MFGDWTLQRHLGDGGNGCVWLAVNSQGQSAAIKLLTKVGNKPYERFRDEVRIINKNSDIEGILPILEYYLPGDKDGGFPWYVMPVAQPMNEYIDGKNLEDVIQVVAAIARTLVELHKRNISHRDIKPENLLVKDGAFFIGDFGLVDYPDKIEITSAGENVGAKWTMAPEMRRSGDKADGKPADVYSLAKTLWIFLTKNKKGFDGQYIADSANGLKNFSIKLSPNDRGFGLRNNELKFTRPLDDLLLICTNDEPSARPTVAKFVEVISDINEQIKNSFFMWQAIQEKIFPSVVPTRVIWERLTDIIEILDLLCSYQVNHMLYPDGGGLDLEFVNSGGEPDTIELIPEGTRRKERILLVKPLRLVYEGFGKDYEWNYFRLETGGLAPTGIDIVHHSREDLVELEDTHYIKGFYWEDGIYKEKKLPPSARLIHRFLRGTFLIIQKTSVYNHFDLYMGLHNQMTTDQFREYVARKRDTYYQIVKRAESGELVSESGMTCREMGIYFLKEESIHEFKSKHKKH